MTNLGFTAYYHCVEMPLDVSTEISMGEWISEEQRNYAPKRKAEYLAGRFCALKACEKAGINLKALPMAEDRSPIWPEGLVGSISHTHGLAIAVISRELYAIGVDAETIIDHERFEKIKKLIVSEDEFSSFEDNPIAPTLIFSAKEALYKALHPKCKEFFGFLEASVFEIGPEYFSIKLHSDKPKVSMFNGIYTGKFSVLKNTVVSWIEIPK